MKLREALTILALTCVAITPLSAKKKKEAGDDLTPLMTAAANCKIDEVNTLLGQGADFKAHDGEGRDALTYASLQRTKHLDLKCSDVVSALTAAGADPLAARFYQSPELRPHLPNKIAVLRVEDIRKSEDKKPISVEKLVNGVEEALSQNRGRMANHTYAAGVAVPIPRGTMTPGAPHYPIMKLDETQEKLKAAGFSAEDMMHPDRKRACSILGTDAVLEVVLKDYGHTDVFFKTAGAAALEYWLTDCRTGELVWRNDPGPVMEARGFLLRGMSEFRILCEMGLSLPRHGDTKD